MKLKLLKLMKTNQIKSNFSKWNIFSALFAILFLTSCGNEQIINNTSSEQDIYLATYDNNSHIASIKFPSGAVTSEDIFFNANNSYLTSKKIEKIKTFLKYIFLFVPDENKIYVVDKNTDKTTSVFDYSNEQLEPIDITFANATEGYVIFRNAPKVAILDVYYFKTAKILDLDAIASSISSIGNQIYLTLPSIDKVAIIDSRDHAVVQSLDVPNAPYLIYPTIDGLKFAVISAGTGKAASDIRDTKTVPSISVIDIASRTIESTNSIEPTKADLTNELPSSFIITNNDWGFFLTDNYIIKIDVRNPDFSLKIESYSYKQLYHNNVYNDLFVLDSKDGQSKIYKLDPVTGKKKENMSTSLNVLGFALN